MDTNKHESGTDRKSLVSIGVHSWCYSTVHNSACKVIEEQTLWGQTVCRVWLPNSDSVVRIPASGLIPLASRPSSLTTDHIAYVAAAAKVAEVLEGSTSATDGHVLLAPMESNVIPLPHQIHALSRAISGDRVRYLLADEVGLGKTIEAGLVMRELKLRGLVRRILVVSPKGIATQWVAEMQTHFNEQFQLVLGDDMATLNRVAGAMCEVRGADSEKTYSALHTPHLRTNPWSLFDQVIVSLDSVKPMDKRRGWTAERVAEYNRSRFEDLITAGWDLVVVDEAHRLGGSTDQVARYKLGKGLAEAAPYVLLLSATPHQGKTDAFHRLMNLLDDDAFPDMDSVSRERVAPYVIRTEKRKAIDADGKPLFKPRRTQHVPAGDGGFTARRNPMCCMDLHHVCASERRTYHQRQSGRFLEKSALIGTKRLILVIRQCNMWGLICGTVSGFRVSRRPSGFYRKHDKRRTKAMDERWLTVDDICKYLNVSNETVYNWIEQRAMPGHRVGRRWMFKQDEVDKWVRSGGAAESSSAGKGRNV